METNYTPLKKRLTLIYYALYVTYALLIIVFGYLLKPAEKGLLIDPLSQKGQIIAYVVIFYVIASIPAALSLFKRAMKTVSQIADEEEQKRRYLSCATTRVVAIGCGAILAIPAFYMLGGYMPMLWCAAIAIVAQFFCKPSERKIYLEINDKHEEDL